MNLAQLTNAMQHPLVEIVGWTLIHFVWQGVAVGFVAAALLRGLRQNGPQARYRVATTAMLMLCLFPVATSIWLFARSDPGDWTIEARTAFNDENVISESLPWENPGIAPLPEVATRNSQIELLQSDKIAGPTKVATEFDLIPTSLLQSILPWLVALWTGGVVLLSLRLLGGMWRVQRWRRTGQALPEDAFVERTLELARRLGIRGRFQLLQSASATVPAVIGWWRPAVIVPVSLLSGLTPSELDSLMAHELAHVRRQDYLINLLQSVAETLLFYHPIVWWLSDVIRAERESCCDDLAVMACGDRVAFLRALARMEELRCSAPSLAMSARNASLLRRISRIALGNDNRPASWWPAGLVSLATMTCMVGGWWISTIAVDAREVDTGKNAQTLTVKDGTDRDDSAAKTNASEDEKKAVHKPEVERVDPKTGQSHHVLSAVKLSVGERQSAKVDMKYSNLFNYTLIPERIARELNAVELGVIDFGERPQPKKAEQSIQIDWQRLVPPPPGADSKPIEKSAPAESVQPVVTVDQLVEPVGDRRIVPYVEDAVWIPDHLAFYGQNRNGQTKFRIVRIDKVDLGLGPAFGPVNALVLDDANSEFGVLGSNWARIPRGKDGEGFVASAVDGFHFLALKKLDPPKLNPIDENEKVLATHTYDLARRESTGWIEVNGVGVPIDAGVEGAGVRVYVTLMQSLVAVDSLTGEVLWHLDEGKQSPTWRKISILELPDPSTGGKLVVVELDAADGKIRRRFHARTGKGLVSSPDNSKEEKPAIQILKQDGERIQLAAIESSLAGRAKAELIRRFQEILMRSGGAQLGDWVTDQETLVSAEKAQYLMHGPNDAMAALEAQEIIFNLPEGSGIRAEFAGENIEITSGADMTKVVVTNGHVELFDSNGLERADASPDGGAEQLVVEVRTVNGEGQLKLQTQRLKPDADFPQPPVQVKCNLATGAPPDEGQPRHGAVRFACEYPEKNEPIRMKIRWHYDLQRLIDEAERETGRTWSDLLMNPDAPLQPAAMVPFQTLKHQQSEIPSPLGQISNGPEKAPNLIESARALGDWLAINSGVRFDSPGYMRLAEELMALEETRRVEALRAMARARLEGQTIVLCRMLFEAKTGKEFRRPSLGGPHFVGTGTEMKNWPLEPITLVGDVPLLIVEGYSLAGLQEPATSYLEYCLTNCAWNKGRFSDIEKSIAAADQAIRRLEFWGGSMDEEEWREWGRLRSQLRPNLVIEVKQQPWINKILPLYSASGIQSTDIREIVKQLPRLIPDDAPVTLIISANAQLDWIKPLVHELATAGFRNQEHIWWQKSHELFEHPELQEIIKSTRTVAMNKVEDDWGPLAEASGLRSRLTLQTKNPTVGQPLLLKLELRNMHKRPTTVDLQEYAPFRVLRAEGKLADGTGMRAPFIGMTPQTFGVDQELAGGEVITAWENVDAADLFLLDLPNCTFYAEGAEWAGAAFKQDSNHLDVKLQPGHLPQEKLLVAELLKRLPNGWKLSRGFGAIYLNHSPTNLKSDVTSIQLWFTGDKLADDFELGKGDQRQEVSLVARTDLGFLNIAAPRRVGEKMWPEYVRDIKMVAARVLVFQDDEHRPESKPDAPNDSAQDDRKPWRVQGLVTDIDGKPLSGVTIHAHCGVGSLFNTGSGLTDEHGRYEFAFGPGIHSESPKLVQAATISVSMDGFTEKNLYRQGDCIAALEKPDEINWGGKTADDLFLPGKPKEINFVMIPAAKVIGLVVGPDGDRLDGVRVSLVGKELPPSSSVVANTRTDKGGRFELTGIPTGFKYQILVEPYEAKPPWVGWASPEFVFAHHDDGMTHFEYSIDGKPVDFSCQQLLLTLNGDGTNWKTALKEAANQKLKLTWDGLSSKSQVSAGMAFLELGEK